MRVGCARAVQAVHESKHVHDHGTGNVYMGRFNLV
jgi:hypothetical protein